MLDASDEGARYGDAHIPRNVRSLIDEVKVAGLPIEVRTPFNVMPLDGAGHLKRARFLARSSDGVGLLQGVSGGLLGTEAALRASCACALDRAASPLALCAR
ncbi:hypothetical protein FHS07_001936 [Microbacterium proteolyticum]|uniref:Uncharacterized protein n=1 Tax=Microbacterium proteolyticum TaxID=1572644 RepID=A0A7W5CID6_9MICO|nr:hypothetical protein [Microbacterium proteolyticum]MBB3158240.1 hypothetical protein [Microbacterium proteolyticum]